MSSKTIKISCYYRFSQEESSLIVIFRYGTGGGKIISLAFMGKIRLLRVSRSLENAFTTIVDLRMLSDTYAHAPTSIHVLFIQISLYFAT